MTSYRDAGVAGLSDEGAFTRAYDAGRQAATTLLAAVGLRVRGQAHHYTVFYALAALEDPTASRFGIELESVRQSRHGGLRCHSGFGHAANKSGETQADLDPPVSCSACVADHETTEPQRAAQGSLTLSERAPAPLPDRAPRTTPMSPCWTPPPIAPTERWHLCLLPQLHGRIAPPISLDRHLDY